MEQRFGKFKLLKKVSTSSLAEIHIAKQPISATRDKLVLLKILRLELKKKPRFVQMFLDEVRIASRLLHPNIAQIHDVGFAEGNYFIATEYLHGEDLRTIYETCNKENSLMPISIALTAASRICTGLHYAHVKTDTAKKPLRIVHCDINPQNIVITFSGEVKILDFGAANVLSRFRDIHNASFREKPIYMSPEQCRSEPIDSRSDIFSTGIVLWELLTGKILYGRSSPAENFHDVIKGKIPTAQEVNSQLPDGIDAIISKALAKNASDRYQTAQEMADALDDLMIRNQMVISPSDIKTFMHDLFKGRIATVRKIEEAQETGGLETMLFEDLNIKEEASPALEVDKMFLPEPRRTIPVGAQPRSPKVTPSELKSVRPPPFRSLPIPERKPRRSALVIVFVFIALGLLAFFFYPQIQSLFDGKQIQTSGTDGGVSKFPQENQPQTDPSIAQGKLIIHTVPEAASVSLDSTEKCVTPCELTGLVLGRSYQLSISKRGHKNWSTKITLDKKHLVSRIELTLQKESVTN